MDTSSPGTRCRTVNLERIGLNEPSLPWETPGTDADLKRYSSLRRAAYAFIPRSFDSEELPPGAVDDLDASVGPLAPGQVILLPRTPRSIGKKDWVVTPATVLAIGTEAVALWIGEPVGGIVSRIQFAEIAAVVDLTVLLFGRLEIIGPEQSIVLRYNMVGRHEISAALEAVRRSWMSGGPVPGAPAGPRPDDLPHKWMALLRSGEMAPRDEHPRLIAAGAVADPRATPRNGIAALCPTELTIVTEPDLDGGQGVYGMDMVAVPRVGARSLTPTKAGLEAVVVVGGGEVRLRIGVHPSLARATIGSLGPALS